MDQTDVKAISISGAGLSKFTTGGTSQVFTSGGRMKGFHAFPHEDGSCYVNFYDSADADDSDPLILRLGLGKASANEGAANQSMSFPQNGIRFNSGLYLTCVAIDTNGTFQSITIFYD